MIWDIPVTNGFEGQVVSWRGNGTLDANEFAPKVFNLTSGVHQLFIYGREPNVQLEHITIIKVELPSPPSALRVVPGS